MFAKKKTEIQIHSLSPMLSEAIKQCRIALDMSPEELSREIRKNAFYVHDLEEAKIAITSETLENCASVFGLSVAELVEIAISEKVLLVATAAINRPKPGRRSKIC